MRQGGSYLAELVRINDTLIWSRDRASSFLDAVAIIREVTGTHLSPAYLITHFDDLHRLQPGDDRRMLLTADDRQREILGDKLASLEVCQFVRPPWVNPGEWPTCSAEHVEAWLQLPEEARVGFGPLTVCVPIHANGRHLGAVLLAFGNGFTLGSEMRDFLAAAGRILGNAVYRWAIADETAQRLRETMLGIVQGEGVLASTAPTKALSGLGIPVRSGSATPVAREPFTDRENAVLRHVVEGMSNEEIGKVLHLSEATVKKHLASMMNKLQVRNRVQVAVFGLRQGIVD